MPPLELTVRAIAVGCAAGALLAATNLYMGLRTGWWDIGTITASILGYAALSRRRRPYSPLENNITQTVAASVGSMPATVGLLGAVPALTMLKAEPPLWALAGFGVALGGVGVVLGALLRPRLIDRENLPFPMGLATAEVITAMHRSTTQARLRSRVLFFSSAASAAVTWFRDAVPRFIPGMWAWPGQTGLGMSVSTMMLGIGVIVGPGIGLSLFLGALIAWAVVAPRLLSSGVVASADYADLVGWLVWPGAALIVGSELTAVARAVLTRRAGAPSTDKTGTPERSPLGRLLAGVAVGSVVGVVVFGLGLGLSFLQVCFALGLSCVLAAVCARSAGQTEIAPMGTMGNLAQTLSGLLGPTTPAANVLMGSVTASDATHTCTSLWAFRTGAQLHAPPRPQIWAELIGLPLGAAVSLPLYGLLTRAYGLGSPSLPAPSAVQWKAIAGLVTSGAAATPASALWAAALALGLGAGLGLLPKAKSGWGLVPAATGVAFIAPFSYSATIGLGALLGQLVRARLRAGADALFPLGAGAIAGEAVVGVVVAALIVLGWVTPG